MAVHMKKLGASRAYREECGEFLCDGVKLLEDAVRSGINITAVLIASPYPYPFPLSAGTRVFRTDRVLIDSLSPLKNAQGILFSCKIPTERGLPDPAGTHILLDGVQDPGNVGAIIRTANAFGIDSVLLTGGCADPYNPKTVRASMGAIFRQKTISLDLSELSEIRAGGTLIIGAGLWEDSHDIREACLGGSIIAIGSEGSGISKEILALCGARISIPIASDCESLNAAVAAAIIIWEARRELRSYNNF